MTSMFCEILKSHLSSVLTEENTQKLKEIVNNSQRIYVIGNGGSNAIASHIAVDYSKWNKVPTMGFTDSSMLTAYLNDFGVENGYLEFLKSHVTDNDLVILISSSGKSINIVNCVKHCEAKNIQYVLLTGFAENNPARTEINKNCALDVWVNSSSYGIVELTHESFLHSIVDN
jgi:D-sedoheptulose 7-phosphate isomerase